MTIQGPVSIGTPTHQSSGVIRRYFFEGAVRIDDGLTPSGAQRWWRHLTTEASNSPNNPRYLAAYFGDTATEPVSTSFGGDDLTPAWEQFYRAFQLTREGDDTSFSVRGPDADGNIVSDAGEVYFWRPPSGEDGDDLYDWIAERPNDEYFCIFADEDPPLSLPAIANRTSEDGDTVDFDTPAVEGGDGSTITLAVTGTPTGLAFTDNGDGTGTFAGDVDTPGRYEVTLTATQGTDEATTTFAWLVTADQTAPDGTDDGVVKLGVQFELAGRLLGWTTRTDHLMRAHELECKRGFAGWTHNDRIALTGTASFVLRNARTASDGRPYTPGDTAAEGFDIDTGVRLLVDLGDGERQRVIWTGHIVDLEETVDPAQPHFVSVQCADYFDRVARMGPPGVELGVDVPETIIDAVAALSDEAAVDPRSVRIET